MRPLLMIIPYFGAPVPWMPFFLASCARNPQVDWLLISDFEIEPRPSNVMHMKISFGDYRQKIEDSLGLPLRWTAPYKLCDLKPALGLVHHDIAGRYDFWGYGDLDVFYGDIMSLYAPLLAGYDVISSHTFLLSGHFSVFRTKPETLKLFSCVKGWKEAFELPQHLAFDERHMTHLLNPYFAPLTLKFAPAFRCTLKVDGTELRVLFKEQYSTFNVAHVYPDGRSGKPIRWQWNDGRLSNDLAGDNLLYCHFSFWNSGRYGDTQAPDAGRWRKNTATSFPDVGFGEIERFHVTRDGISLG